MFRKNCLQKVGLFNEDFKLRDDGEFFIRVLKYFNAKVIPIPLIKVSSNEKQLTKTIPRSAWFKEQVNLIKELYKIFPNEPINENLEELGMYHFDWGKWLLLNFPVKELYNEIRHEFLMCTKYLNNFALGFLFLAFIEEAMGLKKEAQEHLNHAKEKFNSHKELNEWLERLKLRVYFVQRILKENLQ